MQYYQPDFLITPYEVHACKGLRPTDSIIYAVVYWFERMKDGKCKAGNETIARVARCGERAVSGGLERLERYGFIERIYDDQARTIRSEIKTLVHMTRGEAIKDEEPPVKKTKSPKIKQEEVKPGAVIKIDKVDEEPKGPTPGELARDFFAKESKYRESIIDEIAQKTGIQRDGVLSEIRKFYIYWTEPTKSGKKQLWETKTTFEVKRRIYTWMTRAGKYNGNGPKKGSGAGATI